MRTGWWRELARKAREGARQQQVVERAGVSLPFLRFGDGFQRVRKPVRRGLAGFEALEGYQGCQRGASGGQKRSPVSSSITKDDLEVVEYRPPPVLEIAVRKEGT